ncbi:unnamed protein product [Tenebrio molitor]|nr:unnamed protein product [Tenebrio molitor]
MNYLNVSTKIVNFQNTITNHCLKQIAGAITQYLLCAKYRIFIDLYCHM